MKYIIHIGICGFGNQLLGFKELCIIAKKTNRTIILPIFIPHATIRTNCKKYYKFRDIFDLDHFKQFYDCIDIDDIELVKNINNIYNIRHINENNITISYLNEQRTYYNILENTNIINLNKIFITNNNDFNELLAIDDDVLVLLGTFNTIKLSTCSKNGCLNDKCYYYDMYKREYDYVTHSLIHNKYIRDTASVFIINNKLKDYTAFHLRTSDLIGTNCFHKIYNDLLENDVFESIENYMMESDSFQNKLFLAAPPDAFKIKDVKIINSNRVIKFDNTIIDDLFLYSIIELEILKNSKILIYSPTNTPHEKKTHTRSSFVLHIRDQRVLDKVSMFDTCITNIYNNTVKLIATNINPTTQKKIISYCLYNNKDIYNYGLLLNYELKKIIYKDWIMRVYIDNTVDTNLLNYITQYLTDIEVIMVESKISPMYYRFFPINDKNVKCFISRDLDSIIGFKEELMVKEWLDTNKQLHLIHEVYPGHRHIIMAGMLGYRNHLDKVEIKQENKNPENKNPEIIAGDIYYYSPFGGECITKFNNNNDLIIERQGKKLIILNTTLEDFYNYNLIQANWMSSAKLINCKLEKNGNILVQPLGIKHNFYFEKIEIKSPTDKLNDEFNSKLNNKLLINNIYNYYKKLGRPKYIYLDEQNWLGEYFEPILNVNNCLDHNNMSKLLWNYSIKFNKSYKKLDSLYTNLNEHFIGHRVDTKNLYKSIFNFFDISKKYHSLYKIRIQNPTIDYNDKSYLPYKCDWYITNTMLIGDINIPAKTIFVKIDFIESFYNKYYKYIATDNKFILITGGGDITMPNQIDTRYPKFDNNKKIILAILKDERLIHWFAENCDELLEKMSGIPTGVFDNNELTLFYNKQFSNIIDFKDNINVICCHRTRDWTHNRNIVNLLCKNEWSSLVTFKENISSIDNGFCIELSRYTFTLCVNGGGIDPSPKAFEAIIAGSIPIVKKYPGICSAYASLPIVFIDDWAADSITENNLKEWLNRLRPYYENIELRQKVLHQLSDEYWWNYISSI